MASRTAYPTSKEISCPLCAKTMLLKNWKEHYQAKHSMTLSEENLKKEYEKLKQTIVFSPSSYKTATVVSFSDTLFSMKLFSLTKHSPTSGTFNDNSNDNIIRSISNDNNINISNIQHLDSDLIPNISSSIDHQIPVPIQTDSLDTESLIKIFPLFNRVIDINLLSAIDYESNNQDVHLCTPTATNVLQGVEADTQLSPGKRRLLIVILMNVCWKSLLISYLGRTIVQLSDDNCSDTTSDSEIESNDNLIECSSTTGNRLELSTTENQNLNRPIITSKSIPGVIFINSEEMSFVDKQRSAHPHIKWYPDCADRHQKHKSCHKPSAQWFTRERSWLRAICSDGKYGLICTDCSEFGSNSMKIGRKNGGVFIVRPFWKLKHKGIGGMLEFIFL